MSEHCPICEHANEENKDICLICNYDLEEDMWANRKQRQQLRQQAKEEWLQRQLQPVPIAIIEPASVYSETIEKESETQQTAKKTQMELSKSDTQEILSTVNEIIKNFEEQQLNQPDFSINPSDLAAQKIPNLTKSIQYFQVRKNAKNWLGVAIFLYVISLFLEPKSREEFLIIASIISFGVIVDFLKIKIINSTKYRTILITMLISLALWIFGLTILNSYISVIGCGVFVLSIIVLVLKAAD
jgi:hypothetical protein